MLSQGNNWSPEGWHWLPTYVSGRKQGAGVRSGGFCKAEAHTLSGSVGALTPELYVPGNNFRNKSPVWIGLKSSALSNIHLHKNLEGDSCKSLESNPNPNPLTSTEWKEDLF